MQTQTDIHMEQALGIEGLSSMTEQDKNHYYKNATTIKEDAIQADLDSLEARKGDKHKTTVYYQEWDNGLVDFVAVSGQGALHVSGFTKQDLLSKVIRLNANVRKVSRKKLLEMKDA